MKKKVHSQPHPEPQVILQEIGVHLHSVRTQKALSLEEVANRTRIPVRLLSAIEEGKLDILPEPVYTKGFIQKFANALGENGVEIAYSFPAESQVKLEKRKLHWLRLPSAQLRPLHLYLIYVLVVVGAVNSLSALVQNAAIQANNSSSNVSSENDSSNQSSLARSLERVKQVMNLDSSESPVILDVTVKDSSWLRVVVDGKVEFEGVLPQGTQRTWIANEKLTLRAGNAGGIIVATKDQQKKQLGGPGQVQEVTYIANSPL